jgi:hypothetical protein
LLPHANFPLCAFWGFRHGSLASFTMMAVGDSTAAWSRGCDSDSIRSMLQRSCALPQWRSSALAQWRSGAVAHSRNSAVAQPRTCAVAQLRSTFDDAQLQRPDRLGDSATEAGSARAVH